MIATVHPDGLPQPRRTLATVAIALGVVVATTDGAIANVALPTLARVLHAAPADTVWVVNAYQLATVSLLLPLAALGERVGFRRVYLVGLALFMAASAGCALSAGLPALIACRVVQGLGAAGVMSVNGALIRYVFPHDQLGRATGIMALTVASSAAVGPTVGAAVLAVAPWPWLFAINLPVGALTFALGLPALPHSERGERGFDLGSAALNVGAFGCLFAGVETATRPGDAAGGVALLLGGTLSLALLVRRERHRHAPMVPLDLLRHGLFARSILVSVATFATQGLAFVSLPFLFARALGRDAVGIGLLMTPWPIAVALAAPAAGRLADRASAAVLGGVGLAMLATGLLLLATVPPDAGTAAIAARMALCGAGFSLFQTPNSRLLIASAPRPRVGAASGSLATARLTGQTLGVSVAAILFRFPADAPRAGLALAAAVAAVAVCLSLSRLRLRAAGPEAA